MVRDATEKDLAAVQAIYAHHVLTGTGTFEETAPTRDAIAERRAAVLDAGLPYLVAEIDGDVVGFKFGRWLDTVPMQRPLGS